MIRPDARSPLLALALLSVSCKVVSTGTETYTGLRYAIPYDLDRQTKQEVDACLLSAADQAERAYADRQWDMGLITVAAGFSAAGLALTTASTFISPTHADGTANDTRAWTAGSGAVSVGVGAAFFALRTALNLGELASSQTVAAASQGGLAMQMLTEKNQEKRDILYAQCAQLSNKPNGAYPGKQAPTTNVGAAAH
jgi:hypothetical protein